MKHFPLVVIVTALVTLAISCSTINRVFGEPKLKMNDIEIHSLDMSGITLQVGYTISNPYPIGFSVQRVSADVLYDNKTFLSLAADEGVFIEARRSNKNVFTFKIPYDSILSFAKQSKGKTVLPFAFTGSASLSLDSIPFLDGQSLEIPFEKSFEIPVFKPQFAIKNVQVQLPSVEELTQQLFKTGIDFIGAGRLATNILSGKNLTVDVLEGLQINFGLSFDVSVDNQGGAPWEFYLKNCGLKTADNSLINLKQQGKKTATKSGEIITLNATLNSLTTAAFIVQLLGGQGKNPHFTFESEVAFTGLPSGVKLPLAYSYEIPLKSVKAKK